MSECPRCAGNVSIGAKLTDGSRSFGRCDACGAHLEFMRDGSHRAFVDAERSRELPPPFKCPDCSRVSHNPEDRSQGWCGFCGKQTAPRAVNPPAVAQTSNTTPACLLTARCTYCRKEERLAPVVGALTIFEVFVATHKTCEWAASCPNRICGHPWREHNLGRGCTVSGCLCDWTG